MTKNKKTHTRCINLDWLEVYVLEPIGIPHDAAYFSLNEYEVHSRQYGTPLYQEMFTIYEDGFPLLEVRRAPHPVNKDGASILPPNAAHIRLANRTCYQPQAVNILRRFIIAHGYEYKSISRVDICMDFTEFDSKETPSNFVRKWFTAKISKLYQGNFSAHGLDKWSEREVNSIKWGRPTSSITTKLYNKTKELEECGDKFHIRDSWDEAGLDLTKDVWRVEFSINSSVKVLRCRRPRNQEQAEETNEQRNEISFRSLTNFDTADKLLQTFAALASHYFRFKEVEYTDTGKLREKRRCNDHPTFDFLATDANYTPRKVTLQKMPSRTEKILANTLKRMMADSVVSYKQRQLIYDILTYMAKTKRISLDDVPTPDDIMEMRVIGDENMAAQTRYWHTNMAKRAAIRDAYEPAIYEDMMEDFLTTIDYCPF